MAENSRTFASLALSPAFTLRVQYILVQQAPVVMSEVSSTPPEIHAARASLAAAIVKSPAGFAPVFAMHLSANINVTTAGALTGTLLAGTLDTPATDAALLAAIASLWSVVAGVITNP